ncbi:iron-containing redox enzyme family protein [Paracidovorax anthurii]|uniref:Heme oxygenase-like protein n=1 Tax=Paracidovorax anthurii TaxID=78229 RepID=A0A328ZHC0_9BURK|nr:iron-containing redox enzyme family protein [Paracidovorax anthurii]RAR85259.1 heme oxygenase-like protein [Paracidovorax anthurii]
MSAILPASAAGAGDTYSARGLASISEAAAPSPRELCRRLCDDAASEYRLYLAKACLRFFDAHPPRTGRGAPRAEVLAGARNIAALLQRAEGSVGVLPQLRFLVCASDRLLLHVADVRNFSRPLMHVLFRLLDDGDQPAIRATLDDHARRKGAWLGPQHDLQGYLAEEPFDEETFLAACIPAALGTLACERLPEIAGFAHALWHAMALLTHGSDQGRFYRARSRALWQALAGLPDAEAGRARHGAVLFGACIGLLDDATRESAARAGRRAADIMEHKARFALIHHPHVMLAGRRLVEWFNDSEHPGAALLQALWNSHWIRRDGIDDSPFFRNLLGEGGKMHGVFSRPEIESLKAHFRLLAAGEPPVAEAGCIARFGAFLGRDRQAVLAAAPAGDGGDGGFRSAYGAIINAESRPAAIEVARQVLERIGAEFAALRPGMEALPLVRPFAYARADFERRIEDFYYFQAEQTRKLQLDLCDLGLQRLHVAFAPFALVDGCWLRHAGAAELSRGARARLFTIFADEVGNGHHEANHANIYRRLLADMGFEFAEAWQEAFAQDPRIPEQAYKVPSFLLAVGVCSQQYYPETLGINLAIEMSGLDGFYEAMIRNLEKRGLRADFWRVHVSIDNFSSGHARQSVNAIAEHMASVQERYGSDVADLVWARIWTGFLTMIYLFRVELAVLMSGVASATATRH